MAGVRCGSELMVWQEERRFLLTLASSPAHQVPVILEINMRVSVRHGKKARSHGNLLSFGRRDSGPTGVRWAGAGVGVPKVIQAEGAGEHSQAGAPRSGQPVNGRIDLN